MKTPIGVSREVNQLSRIKDPESPARRGFLKASLGYFMLPALSTPWLVSCGGSSSSIAPTPRLTSVNNFRDVAGTSDQEAYSTSNGRKLRRGVIYRSNVLTPSPTDLATLNTLNIRADYDLRTPGEIKLQPDSPLAGASYLNVNLIGTPTNPTPNLASAADGISFMENSYTELVTDSGVRDRLAQLFQKLATTSDSQVYHCSGGKDRTGWVTTILLNVMGRDHPRLHADKCLFRGLNPKLLSANDHHLWPVFRRCLLSHFDSRREVSQCGLEPGGNKLRDNGQLHQR